MPSADASFEKWRCTSTLAYELCVSIRSIYQEKFLIFVSPWAEILTVYSIFILEILFQVFFVMLRKCVLLLAHQVYIFKSAEFGFIVSFTVLIGLVLVD